MEHPVDDFELEVELAKKMINGSIHHWINRKRTYPGYGAPGGVTYADRSGCTVYDGTSPDWRGAAWYRVQGDAGSKITDQAIGSTNGGQNKCGTAASG